MSPGRLSVSLPLMLLPLLAMLLASSGAVVFPVLPWGETDLDVLATPAVGSCAQCGVFCLLQPDCRAVSCSGVADTGNCQLLGEWIIEMDFCDADWTQIGGACFSLQTEKLEWSEAKDVCRQLRPNSELASIHSDQEINELKNVLFGQGAYIGLVHTGPSASYNFSWLDGTPFDFSHWRDRQPNDNTANNLCVVAERETILWLDYTVQEGMLGYGQLCKYVPEIII